MDTRTPDYAQPTARTRLDNVASSLVLATMLASVLAGAVVAEPDADSAARPDRYAAAEILP